MKHYARSRSWCEWQEFDQWQARALSALSDPDAAATSPFHLLSLPGMDGLQQRAGALRWMKARAEASAPERLQLQQDFAASLAQQTARRAQAGHRIRLGYLSGDFHQHATALLMVEMLEAQDRQRFELHAYSHGADDGLGMRQRLQACFEGFHEVAALNDAELARQIHADGIDLLVDLKGYTAGSRTAVLMARPAPVQVSYLGYPGTLGGDFCDYLISDDFITPPGSAGHYSEALACLPHSYQPHGRARALAAAPSRAEAGLPEQGLVLCCFNQSWKFTPEVFALWCRLLAQLPGSVLWLLKNEGAQGNLRREAMQRGISPERLVFAPDAAQPQHLARLALADLVLDTSPYNAHTTGSDALWAGVPMVTCAGQTFASRVAGSLLHAVGLPELVTNSLADYEALALGLCSEPGRLAALRQKLAGLRAGAPLFDVPAYTRALEALFEAMWARHQAGLPPAALGAGASAH